MFAFWALARQVYWLRRGRRRQAKIHLFASSKFGLLTGAIIYFRTALITGVIDWRKWRLPLWTHGALCRRNAYSSSRLVNALTHFANPVTSGFFGLS